MRLDGPQLTAAKREAMLTSCMCVCVCARAHFLIHMLISVHKLIFDVIDVIVLVIFIVYHLSCVCVRLPSILKFDLTERGEKERR